jgi:hypothetical protein
MRRSASRDLRRSRSGAAAARASAAPNHRQAPFAVVPSRWTSGVRLREEGAEREPAALGGVQVISADRRRTNSRKESRGRPSAALDGIAAPARAAVSSPTSAAPSTPAFHGRLGRRRPIGGSPTTWTMRGRTHPQGGGGAARQEGHGRHHHQHERQPAAAHQRRAQRPHRTEDMQIVRSAASGRRRARREMSRRHGQRRTSAPDLGGRSRSQRNA